MEHENKLGIGETLRRRRAERKISLAEAQSATKINKKFLEALEEEDFDVIPTRVAAKGFLRIYATYLGINPEPLIKKLESVAREEHTSYQSVSRSVSRGGGGIKEVILKYKISRKYMYAFVLILLCLFLFIYLLWGCQSEPVGEKKETPVIPKEKEETAYEGVNLLVEFLEKTWINIELDDGTSFAETFNEGDSKLWKARNWIKIKVGNAGGVYVMLNGRTLGMLGRSGEVVEREFTAQ